ncbi:hypothetical protein QPM04_21455, partial [Massilia varians]
RATKHGHALSRQAWKINLYNKEKCFALIAEVPITSLRSFAPSAGMLYHQTNSPSLRKKAINMLPRPHRHPNSFTEQRSGRKTRTTT